MRRTRENGGLIMMHAENGPVIDVLPPPCVVAEGTTDPIWHGVAHDPILEGEATNRVIRLAEAAGVPVYVVHLSSPRRAGRRSGPPATGGRPVFAETCPQYLFLTLEDLGNGFEGAKFVCSPPLRPEDHLEDLWRGLRTDDLQVVATDHCPFDFHGQKELGRGDFRRIPNGLPAVEDRVDLLHDGGVVGGRISPRALGRDHGDGPGQDVRDVPAEGHDRGRLGRRHRRLRPEPEADDQRRDPPHERRLLDASRARVSRAPPTSS